MASMRQACSVCGREVCSDLILSIRSRDPYGKWIPQARKIVEHVYLCEKHYEMFLDFMQVYTRRENDEQ